MIRNTHDLSVIVSVVGKFGKRGIRKSDLFASLHSKSHYIQWNIRPRELLAAATRLGLLDELANRITLTTHGENILNMSLKGIDLNHRQLMYIAENCVLTNKTFSHLTNFLKLFVFDKEHETMIYNTADYPISDTNDMELLTQLDVIHKKKNLLLLNRQYLDFVEDISRSDARHSRETSKFTQERLERILKEQKEIGRLAEDLSIEYEKRRLQKKSLHDEASRIKHVSTTNVGIGYDIASFRQRTPSMKHDRFIEVKARKHTLNSFIMSHNEIQVAKKLRSAYVIHFWNGLEYNRPTQPTRIIEDPVNKLKIRECKNCLAYVVSLDNVT